MSEQKHLWEYDHPYYCNEGNYFASGYDYHRVHTDHDSWQSFVEDGFFDSDPELNLLFRWDWIARHLEDPEEYPDESHQLKLYFILQRKANLHSNHVTVTAADEPAIRAWLVERATSVSAIWEPLIGGAA